MPSTQYFLVDNKTKNLWNFQPENHDGQLQNIDGIGFGKTKIYNNANDFYITTQSIKNQNIILGEVVFLSEKKYAEFVDFIKSESLSLKRVSPADDELFIDVSIDSFKKNDADRFNEEISFCDINFVASSPWYRSKKTYEYIPSLNNPKSYNYKYPYQYNEHFKSYYALTNESKSNAVVVIYIYGESKNPHWRYYTNDDSVQQSGLYNGTVPAGQYLKIDSTPNNLEVALYDYKTSKKIKDVYSDCSLSLEIFFEMQPGSGIFDIYDDEGFQVGSRIEIKELEQCP